MNKFTFEVDDEVQVFGIMGSIKNIEPEGQFPIHVVFDNGHAYFSLDGKLEPKTEFAELKFLHRPTKFIKHIRKYMDR